MLLTLSGPSGVGKTTLEGRLVLLGATPLMSYTTRAPRTGDLEGEYTYLSHAQFEQYMAAGAFLWDREIHGNRYGTRSADIDQALKSRVWHVAILTIDVLYTLYQYAQERHAVRRFKPLYLLLDDEEELRRRLHKRREVLKDIERRIRDCRSWNNRVRTLPVELNILDATRNPGSLARKVRKSIGS